MYNTSYISAVDTSLAGKNATHIWFSYIWMSHLYQHHMFKGRKTSVLSIYRLNVGLSWTTNDLFLRLITSWWSQVTSPYKNISRWSQAMAEEPEDKRPGQWSSGIVRELRWLDVKKDRVSVTLIFAQMIFFGGCGWVCPQVLLSCMTSCIWQGIWSLLGKKRDQRAR